MDNNLNTVTIPSELSLARKPNPRDELSSEDMQKFDGKTLFYDIFLDQAGKRLIGIGPPAMNLRGYVSSVKVYIDGKKRRHNFQDLPEHKLSFLEIKASPGDESLILEFRDFSVNIDLLPNSTPVGKKILAAISKDNEPEWVATWADFHRHSYDLDEVIVYDNGSKNIDELSCALDGKATIIDWKFPYGPPGKRFNKFAQPGALNHCIRKFGLEGTLYNFDIDELLIADRESLENELSTNGTVYVDSYNVPRTFNIEKPYTHYDFTLRHPDKRKQARKFICETSSVDIISQHNTWKSSRIPFSGRLNRAKPERLESRHAYFLHFLAITTNWQPELGKLDIVEEGNLVQETSHLKTEPRKYKAKSET